MPERIRFHLDENVNPAIALALQREGINVTTSQEAKLLSQSDRVQLEFARSQSRVLVTHDDDFLILNSQGIDHAGIVYAQKNAKPIGYIIQMLTLLYKVALPAQMSGHVEYL